MKYSQKSIFYNDNDEFEKYLYEQYNFKVKK